MKKLTVMSRGVATGAASLVLAAISTATVSAATPAPAPVAATKPITYQTNLTQLNKSGASGTATVTIDGKNVTVDLRATGLSPNLTHAQHIHVGGLDACPNTSADTDKDGWISAKEADAAVGPIKISLTTAGDVSPSSALVLDRLPKSDAKGNLTYKRTFALPSGVSANDMTKASVELHGLASIFDDKTKYDGTKKSELDANLPFEATAPVACGNLASTPDGAPNTGLGTTAGIEQPITLIAGAAAIIAAALLVTVGRRPSFGKRD